MTAEGAAHAAGYGEGPDASHSERPGPERRDAVARPGRKRAAPARERAAPRSAARTASRGVALAGRAKASAPRPMATRRERGAREYAGVPPPRDGPREWAGRAGP